MLRPHRADRRPAALRRGMDRASLRLAAQTANQTDGLKRVTEGLGTLVGSSADKGAAEMKPAPAENSGAKSNEQQTERKDR